MLSELKELIHAVFSGVLVQTLPPDAGEE